MAHSRPSVSGFARWLCLILLLGAVVRVFGVLATQDAYVPYSDTVRFLWMAEEHLGGALVHPPEFHHPLFPWLLTVAFWLFGDSLLVARLASALPHLLLLIPLSLWARGVLGDRVALWTAGLCAFLPGMLSACLEVFDVNLAALVLALMLWTRLVSRPFLRGLLGGALTGVGYLTRPEFPVFGVGLALASLVAPVPAGANRKRGIACEWAGLLLGMAVVSGPYLIHLRSEYGKWIPSPKWAAEIEGMHTTATTTGAHTLARMGRLSWVNVKSYLRVFLPMAIHPLLWVALLFGVLGASRAKGSARMEQELALLAASFSLTLPITLVPNYRYLVVVFPLLLPWLALGLDSLWCGALVRVLLIPIFLAVLFLQSRSLASGQGSFGMDWPRELREAGMWIRDHSPQDARIGYGRSTAVYFAERRMAPLPAGDLARQMDLADFRAAFQRTGARYVILSERFPPEEPALSMLSHSPVGAVFRHDWGSGKGVAVFDLAAEAGAQEK